MRQGKNLTDQDRLYRNKKEKTEYPVWTSVFLNPNCT